MRTTRPKIRKTFVPKLEFRISTIVLTICLIQFVGFGRALGAGAVLGVHSNVDPDTSINIVTRNTGHAWITLTENAVTTRYGLWPDCHKVIKADGLANGAGSDVRTNFQGDLAGGGRWNKTYKLTAAQKANLLAFIAVNQTWGRNDTNCAAWASKAVEMAGQGVLPVADTVGGILKNANTPRKMSQAIKDAGGTKDANFTPGGSCTSGCNSCSGSNAAAAEDCATTDFCCEDCVVCQSTPCAFPDLQVPGACCHLADNQCSQQTELECKALGSDYRYRGDGTPCGLDGICIPTLSEWGVAVMAMLVLTAGTIVVMRRRAAVA